jgi:hypothetical protein
LDIDRFLFIFGHLYSVVDKENPEAKSDKHEHENPHTGSLRGLAKEEKAENGEHQDHEREQPEWAFRRCANDFRSVFKKLFHDIAFCFFLMPSDQP